MLLPVTSWSGLAQAGFSAPGLIRLSAGVVQALYDPVEVGNYLCYPAEGHVIGDVDARRQGEPDSDELRDDDVGDFDGRAGWGQAGTWLRGGIRGLVKSPTAMTTSGTPLRLCGRSHQRVRRRVESASR